MSNRVKEIALWLLDQGAAITGEVLEEKLQEAYNQGRLDSFHEQVAETIDNIRSNTMLEIKRRKQVLFENNFYNIPSEEAIIEMKALEYLEEHIPEIVVQYTEC